MLNIRPATESDKPAIWQIIKAVIAGGDTYFFAPDASEDEMMAFWFTPDTNNYVAELDGEIPDAMHHSKNGLTNAYIMYRKL